DAHQPDWFAYGLDRAYQIAADAGFEEVSFRREPRGSTGANEGRVSIEIPERFRAAAANR
ncbi:MAG TPA: hypothetical protein VIB99_06010, partial [Candidatus Limnocylindrales bacterium]